MERIIELDAWLNEYGAIMPDLYFDQKEEPFQESFSQEVFESGDDLESIVKKDKASRRRRFHGKAMNRGDDAAKRLVGSRKPGRSPYSRKRINPLEFDPEGYPTYLQTGKISLPQRKPRKNAFLKQLTKVVLRRYRLIGMFEQEIDFFEPQTKAAIYPANQIIRYAKNLNKLFQRHPGLYEEVAIRIPRVIGFLDERYPDYQILVRDIDCFNKSRYLMKQYHALVSLVDVIDQYSPVPLFPATEIPDVFPRVDIIYSAQIVLNSVKKAKSSAKKIIEHYEKIGEYKQRWEQEYLFALDFMQSVDDFLIRFDSVYAELQEAYRPMQTS